MECFADEREAEVSWRETVATAGASAEEEKDEDEDCSGGGS